MDTSRLGVLEQEGWVEVVTRSKKQPSSRYKGVIAQPNGRWGAQIYEEHERVWLGTFKDEDEAAKVYDIAAQRFRGEDAIKNINHIAADDKEAAMEASFLSRHSKSEIVDMLRKHTYNDELEQSKRSRNVHQTISSASFTRQHLFQKTLTPSDVGKSKRLVIPKHHARKHLPVPKGGGFKGVLLYFEDEGSKVWRFRYSYWDSCQGYVLTKGWGSFVKAKSLKAGDSVSFYRSNRPDKRLYIDCQAKTRPIDTNSHSIEPVKCFQPVQVLRLFGVDISSHMSS